MGESTFDIKILKKVGYGLITKQEVELLSSEIKLSLKSWNIIDYNTPTYSSQWNRMFKAFSRAFKKDYAFRNYLDSAQTLLY